MAPLLKQFSYLKKRSFLQIVEDSIEALNKSAQEPKFRPDEQQFGKYLYTLRFSRNKFDQTIVSRGVYVYDVARFLASYPRQDVLIVTGRELIVNPAQVMINIQNLLHVPTFIGRSNFVINKATGFYCLSIHNRRYCLPATKSKTTGVGKPAPDPRFVQKLEDFYEPYNRKLFDLLGYEV